MVDMIFAVDDPLAWHEDNFRRHRDHYAGAGHLGPKAVSMMQTGFGAGMWYNALVSVPMDASIQSLWQAAKQCATAKHPTRLLFTPRMLAGPCARSSRAAKRASNFLLVLLESMAPHQVRRHIHEGPRGGLLLVDLAVRRGEAPQAGEGTPYQARRGPCGAEEQTGGSPRGSAPPASPLHSGRAVRLCVRAVLCGRLAHAAGGAPRQGDEHREEEQGGDC